KATEVVKRGFMSNLLFANITGIFSAPQIVLDTLNNLTPEREGKLKPTNEEVDTEDVSVNEDGEAEIDDQAVMDTTGAILGDKIYGMEIVIADDAEEKPKDKLVKDLTKTIVDSANFNKIMEEAQKTTEATKRDAQRAQKRFEEKIERDIRRQVDEVTIKKHIDEKDYKAKANEEKTNEEVEKLSEEIKNNITQAYERMGELAKQETAKTVENTLQDFVEEQDKKRENKKKNSIEEDV